MTESADGVVTIGSLAEHVRAKNAGPFWITLDVFFDRDEAYDRVAQSEKLTPAAIASEYHTEPTSVLIFRIPSIRAIKISFPRPVTQGSFADRDMHSGQQHILLSRLAV
jgi:hypothetical protein